MNINTVLDQMENELAGMEGKLSFYFETLEGEKLVRSYQPNLPVIAASVIKIPVMIEFFQQVEDGILDPGERVEVLPSDRLPSCGALNYMDAGLHVTLNDLCTLMIILSDNTATNMLIKRLGMEKINARMEALGLHNIHLVRLLFDSEASARGLENRVTTGDIAALLKLIYQRKLPGSERMLQNLKDQRLNGKIPFYLYSMGVKVAHKTGEDGGITHDAAIVLGEKPFILCFFSEETQVPAFERFMQEKALEIYQAVNKK